MSMGDQRTPDDPGPRPEEAAGDPDATQAKALGGGSGPGGGSVPPTGGRTEGAGRGRGAAATLGAVSGLLAGSLAAYLTSAAMAPDPGANVPRPDPAVAALQSRVEALERTSAEPRPAAELPPEVAEMRERLTALENRSAATPPAQDPPQELQALEQRLAEAERQLGALGGLESRLNQINEQRQADAGGVQTRLDEIAGRIASLEQALTQEAAALRSRADELGSRVSALEQLGPRLDEMSRRLAGLDPLAQRVGEIGKGVEALQEFGPRIAALEEADRRLAGIDENARRIAAIEDRLRDQPALAVAVAALQSAISRGAPYTSELAAVQRFGEGADGHVALLKDRAETGVPTLAALREQFRDVEDAALEAQEASTGGTVVDRILQNAQSAVRVRSSEPPPRDGTRATLARIRAALEAGEPVRALAEWETLPEPARKASEAWASSLRARVAADEALVALVGSLAAPPAQ